MVAKYKHTATSSDGTVVVKNFNKVYEWAIQTTNVQIDKKTGLSFTQRSNGFASNNKPVNRFGKISGISTTEVVRALVEEN